MAFIYARIKIIFIGCGILLLLLTGRLIYLQVVAADELAARGLMSRVHELKAETMRGEIYDRNFEPLTNINKRNAVTFFPGQCKDKAKAGEILCTYGKIDSKKATRIIEEAKRPIKIIDGIDKETVNAINGLQVSGIVVSEEIERYSSLASHLIGYVNHSDNRGISGLEAGYNEFLQDGGQKYLAALLDAKADLIPGLSYRKISLANTRGEGLVLTIDKSIQEKAERVFDRYASKGAVVIMEPYTGHILAMISRPNFNAQNLAESLGDANSPLINRAITAYQPGSVLKLAVAAAALEQGKVTPAEKFLDKGYIDVDGTIFNGWDVKVGAKEISFSDAIVYSSNPVLIEVGLRIGMNDLTDFLKKFGFGSKSDLNLYGEEAGNLPDKKNFYRGELANLSIGQGECEATPVQVAQLIAAIVNDGVKVHPFLVKAIVDGDKSVVKEYHSIAGERLFSSKNASFLRQMMAGVTERGTGRAAFTEVGGSAGKTGSAETGRVDKAGKGINHAWFAGYAPLERPQYAVVVFVEEGMSGGDVAAPIFRKIIEILQDGNLE